MPWAITKIQAARSGLTVMGASDSCGVRASRATSVTASEVGTLLLGPMMASTLFSVTSLRAVRTAADGSVASSSAMYSTARPPSVLGSRGTVLRYSEPIEAPGPVLLAMTPMRDVGQGGARRERAGQGQRGDTTIHGIPLLMRSLSVAAAAADRHRPRTRQGAPHKP